MEDPGATSSASGEDGLKLAPGGALEQLELALVAGRELGLIGPGPIDRHMRHARGFAGLVGTATPGSMLDLGSGAGLPGLVLAVMLPATEMVLLEARQRRAQFLERTVAELGLAGRVTVLHARAEEAGRSPRWRETFDVVTSRSFGPPGATAECGAPLVRVGGMLVVSNPPRSGGPGQGLSADSTAGPERWPARGLEPLGLLPGAEVSSEGFSFQVLSKAAPCADRHPRPNGVPARRPLF